MAVSRASRHIDSSASLGQKAIAPQEDDIAISRAIIQDFAARFNAVAGKNGILPLLDVAPMPMIDYKLTALAAAYRQNGRDFASAIKLYNNQIEVIVEVLESLETTDQHIAILAETQFGKTGILCASIILYNLFQYHNTDKALVRLINPNFVGQEKQTSDDFDFYLAVLGYIKCGEITATQANCQKTVNYLSRTSRKANTRRNNDMTKALLDSIAKNSSPDDLIASVVDTAVPAHFKRMITIIDEADEALGSNGFVAKLLDAANGHVPPMRLIFCSATAWEYKHLQDFRVIEAEVTSDYSGFVRGTPLSVTTFGAVGQITGTNFKEKVVETNHRDIEKIILGIADGLNPETMVTVKHLVGGEIVSKKTPARDIGVNGLPYNGGSHIMIRYGKSIKNDLNILKENIRRSLAKKGITFLTMVGSNAGTNMVIYAPKHPEAMSDGYIVKNISAKDCETVDLLLTAAEKHFNEASKHHKYGKFHAVIGVVSLARRAMRFPKECAVYLDFTDKPSTMTSLEQGTIGRASGWFKEVGDIKPLIIVSDKMHETVLETRKLYFETGQKIAVIKPSQYATGSYRAPVTRQAISIPMSPDFSEFEEFSQELQDKLGLIASLVEQQTIYRNSKTGIGMSPHRRFSFKAGNTVELDKDPSNPSKVVSKGWGYIDQYTSRESVMIAEKIKHWSFIDMFGILGEDGIAELEAHYSEQFGSKVTLLTNQGARYDGRKYGMDSNGFVHFGLRAYDDLDGGPKMEKHGSSGLRAQRGPTYKNNGADNIVEPNAIMSVNTKKMMRMTLVLKNTVVQNRTIETGHAEVITLPKPNTAMYDYVCNDDERATSDLVMASK